MKKVIFGAALLLMLPTAVEAESNSHTIQKGETLYRVSLQYQVTVGELKEWNGLTDNMVRTGQVLMVQAPLSAKPIPAVSPAPAETVYQVKKGDTLYGISKATRVSLVDLRAWNGLAGSSIKAGQRLRLTPHQASPTPEKREAAVEASPSLGAPVYLVVKGDTLYRISQKTGASVTQLRTWNELTSDTLYIGQSLRTAAPEQTAVEKKPVEKKEEIYTVQSGDTLQKVADAYQKTVAQLMKTNNLSNTTLYVGQRLIIEGENLIITYSPEAVIATAKTYTGVPYVWGGTTPSGFDCSGFLQYVYAQYGVPLPRTTQNMWKQLPAASSLEEGDLVMFTTYEAGPSHAGIYLGGNQFIHSGSKGVGIADMTSSYWQPRYLGARRPYEKK